MQPEHAANNDLVLASFLEQGSLPEVAKRVNMSLASLATWASKHADLLTSLHQLITARCKLIAAQLQCAALSALATVSAAATQTDDTKLRERALERQRKAACAILRHKPPASVGTGFPACVPTPSRGTDVSLAATHLPSPSPAPETAPFLDAPMPHVLMPHAPMPHASMPHASMPSSSRSTPPPKPSLASRFAARRLAALATERA